MVGDPKDGVGVQRTGWGVQSPCRTGEFRGRGGGTEVVHYCLWVNSYNLWKVHVTEESSIFVKWTSVVSCDVTCVTSCYFQLITVLFWILCVGRWSCVHLWSQYYRVFVYWVLGIDIHQETHVDRDLVCGRTGGLGYYQGLKTLVITSSPFPHPPTACTSVRIPGSHRCILAKNNLTLFILNTPHKIKNIIRNFVILILK